MTSIAFRRHERKSRPRTKHTLKVRPDPGDEGFLLYECEFCDGFLRITKTLSRGLVTGEFQLNIKTDDTKICPIFNDD